MIMKKVLLVLCSLVFSMACGKSQEGMDIPTSSLSPITQAPTTASASKAILEQVNNSGSYGTCSVRRKADGNLAWSITAGGLPPGTTANLFIVSQDDLFEDLVAVQVKSNGTARSGQRTLSPAPLSGAGISCAITDQAIMEAQTTIFPAP
jgi:hypothetical protein